MSSLGQKKGGYNVMCSIDILYSFIPSPNLQYPTIILCNKRFRVKNMIYILCSLPNGVNAFEFFSSTVSVEFVGLVSGIKWLSCSVYTQNKLR